MSARPVICLETGVRYPSARAAACEMGIPVTAVRQACVRGWRGYGYHFFWADAPQPPAGFFSKRTPTRRCRCIETGETFDKITEAAEAVGVTVAAISCACTNGYRSAGKHWTYLDA